MLAEEAEKDETSYLAWYNDFQFYLKEGLSSEPDHQDALMPLMRYQTNFTSKLINIDEYMKKMEAEQENIYFILAPNRAQALSSPYMEPFKDTKIPVLVINMHIDEMVFRQLQTYKGKYKFVNVETAFEDLSKDIK